MPKTLSFLTSLSPSSMSLWLIAQTRVISGPLLMNNHCLIFMYLAKV